MTRVPMFRLEHVVVVQTGRHSTFGDEIEGSPSVTGAYAQ